MSGLVLVVDGLCIFDDLKAKAWLQTKILETEALKTSGPSQVVGIETRSLWPKKTPLSACPATSGAFVVAHEALVLLVFVVDRQQESLKAILGRSACFNTRGQGAKSAYHDWKGASLQKKGDLSLFQPGLCRVETGIAARRRTAAGDGHGEQQAKPSRYLRFPPRLREYHGNSTGFFSIRQTAHFTMQSEGGLVILD